MAEISKLRAEYSQRFGYAMSSAKDSDYYSADGKTWDPSADWNSEVKYIFGSDDYKAFIFNEIRLIMDPSNTNPPAFENLNPELRAWLTRIEERD
jgi:hypothetical protein